MAATRRTAMNRATALGAHVTEGQGRRYEFNVEAPAGTCWQPECHELINERGTYEPAATFWADVLLRMERGVMTCATPNCEWCADVDIETAPPMTPERAAEVRTMYARAEAATAIVTAAVQWRKYPINWRAELDYAIDCYNALPR